ncbi:MAG: DUF4430 domain-containing protein [Suipraeoptans sp.]
MKNKSSNKNIIIAIVTFIVIVAILLIGYNLLKPQPTAGDKTVNITVVSADETETDYTTQTDAEYLQQVMDEVDGLTYAGSESDYGLMVEEVNGETASFTDDGAYWGFYVNNEYCNYGIGEQPVEDGDHFKIVYTTE